MLLLNEYTLGLAAVHRALAEFPSVANINAFWESDEYQKDCKPLREGSGIYDIGVFEAPPPDKV